MLLWGGAILLWGVDMLLLGGAMLLTVSDHVIKPSTHRAILLVIPAFCL